MQLVLAIFLIIVNLSYEFTLATTVTEVVEQYSLILEGQIVKYIAQPEAGYVFRIVEEKKPTLEVRSLRKENNQSGLIVLPPGARPLSNSDQEGIYVVNSLEYGSQNISDVWVSLDQTPVTYKAPLFSCNGVTIAVIPEIVVRIESEIDLEQLSVFCQSLNLAIIKPLEFTTKEYLISVLGSSPKDVFKAVEALNGVEWIEWAAPNMARSIEPCGQILPNDEYFPNQWHLHNIGQSGGTPGADINAPEAWEITTGDPNIVVAVIDDGVDTNHPDLNPNLVPGYDFVEDDDWPHPDPNNRHGTACAGLVAAQGNNNIGVTGVAYNCKIMPLRIEFGEPNDPIRETMFATAIRWAAVHGADVISNSWGHQDIPWPIVHSAIIDVTKPGGLGRQGKGSVCVFSAGNNSNAEGHWPSDYPEAISVGATNHNDLSASYTNFGPKIDIVAPGGETASNSNMGIWTTDLLGAPGFSGENEDPNMLDYTDSFCGTSAAAPIIAGVAALILSIEPNLTNEQVYGFVTCSSHDLGDPGWDEHFGWGRVDARAALDTVLAKRADLNDDWKVDEQDLAILNAAIDNNDLSGDIAPVKRDGVVDDRDMELLYQYWQVNIREPFLLAHWALDETEGYIAHDSVSQNHAELFGAPMWQPTKGMIDGALLLDGDDDFVGTEYVLDPSEGPFSVFVWVKGGAPGQVVVSQLWSVNWLMADSSQGYLQTELREASHAAQSLVSEVTITDGNWHHVGVTWDGMNRVLYVDNVKVAADTQSSLARSVEGLNIGCGPDMMSGTFFSGLIDDVRIYNVALTAEEIAALAQ